MPGASISLRHTQTTREFKLIGPASVLPCRAGSEQLLLAAGQLTTSANLGVRPGAEVLIATPQGTIRYGTRRSTWSSENRACACA